MLRFKNLLYNLCLQNISMWPNHLSRAQWSQEASDDISGKGESEKDAALQLLQRKFCFPMGFQAEADTM